MQFVRQAKYTSYFEQPDFQEYISMNVLSNPTLQFRRALYLHVRPIVLPFPWISQPHGYLSSDKRQLPVKKNQGSPDILYIFLLPAAQHSTLYTPSNHQIPILTHPHNYGRLRTRTALYFHLPNY